MGGRPGIVGDDFGVGVLDGVANLVVARVLGHAGTSVEESKGLVEIAPERRIVAAVGQNGGGCLKTLAREPVQVDLLDDLGAAGSNGAVGPAVVVTNTIVTPRHHVVVEVREDVVHLMHLEVGGVVCRTEQSILLSSPPDESKLVLEAVFLDRLENLEDQAASGGYFASATGFKDQPERLTIIVDTRTGLDGVQMSTKLLSIRFCQVER